MANDLTRRGLVAAAPAAMLGASTAAAAVVAMSGRDPVFAQIELHKSLVDRVRDYPGDDEDPAFEAICRDEEAAIQALGSMKPSTVAAAAAQLQYMADVEGCFADKSSPFWRTVRIFEHVVQDRRGVASDIETQIRNLGGTPEDEGTMLASAHRVLMKLRDAISSGDTAVVDEAERGEDHIKAKFERAAEDKELSPGIQRFVAEMATRVRAGHDRIRDLKHSLHH